jgi:hypothetical protein
MNKNIKELVQNFIGSDIVDDNEIDNSLADYNYKYYPQTKEELEKDIREALSQGLSNLNCINVSAIQDFSHVFHNVIG